MTSLTVLNHQINQVDNLYCLNDLHKASGGIDKHRPAFFLRNQETIDLITELDNETKVYCENLHSEQKQSANLQSEQVLRKINGGQNRGTYACKEIVYRYAMWISPKFALAVIRVFDAFVTGNLEQKRDTISTTQQQAIRTAVAKRCQKNSVHYQTVYEALKKQFDIPRYNELLAVDFDEALRFIQSVELIPQIENKPFEILDFKVTSQVIEYLQDLRREITRLGGNIPNYPTLDEQTIVQAVVTRMIQSHRMMLSFDPFNGANIKIVPQNNWIVTEENIADIVGSADGIKKDKLPDIMNAILKRMGFNR